MKINEGYVEEESLEVNRRIILWESKSPYNKEFNRKTYWVVRVNLSSRGFSPFIRYVNSTTPMIFTDSLTAPNHSRALPGVSKLVFAWRVTLRSCLTFSFLYEKNDATPSLTFRMHVRVFRSWMSSSLRQTNLLHTYESIDTSGEGTRQEANQNTAFALSLPSCMVSRVQKPDNAMKWKTVQHPPEGRFEYFYCCIPGTRSYSPQSLMPFPTTWLSQGSIRHRIKKSDLNLRILGIVLYWRSTWWNPEWQERPQREVGKIPHT